MKCIIVDDEPLARQGMEINVNDLSYLQLVGQFSSGIAAAEYVMNNEVDLIFLDIEMPGLNGLEFIRSLNQKPIIILTTAYPQYALEAFELDVLDYLVKPIRFDRFFKAVSKARDLYELKNQPVAELTVDPKDAFMYIKADRKIIKLFFNEISFIKGMKDYVIVHSKQGKYMTAMNIKTINAQLPDDIFARVSKSYVINVNLIKSIEQDIIDLNGDEIPLGNSYKKDFLASYIKGNLVDRSKK